MKQFLEGLFAGCVMVVPPLLAWLFKSGALA
jgi:hypothetical protein